MLPTNQAGDFITPENVFHSLITRLVKLKDGIRRSDEVEIDYKEIIDSKYNPKSSSTSSLEGI